MKTKTRIFIIEDELIHSEALKITIEECGFELVGECDNADNAFEMIKKSMPDVILADISLPGFLNGITLSKKVHNELGIPHIFTTSFTQDEIIEEAVKTNPAGYLRKPVEATNLKAAVKIAIQEKRIPEVNNAGIESIDHKAVFTKVGNKLIRIDFADIIVIKADGENFISLVTKNREIPCRITLKSFSEQLPTNFIRTHRAYIINIDHLDAFNEQEQTAVLGTQHIPVARSYKKEFLNSIFRI